MIRYLFASHGPLASGMAESVTFIAGKEKHIDTICAYMDPSVSLAQQIEDVFNTYDSNDDVVVLTDLYGGSVNNEFVNLLQNLTIYNRVVDKFSIYGCILNHQVINASLSLMIFPIYLVVS